MKVPAVSKALVEAGVVLYVLQLREHHKIKSPKYSSKPIYLANFSFLGSFPFSFVGKICFSPLLLI